MKKKKNSILDDVRSVWSGVKKAKRDYAKIKAFDTEHEARHEADPHYNCAEFQHDFWENLGRDVHPDKNIFEAAAYRSSILRRIGESDVDAEPQSRPKVSSVAIERDGTETPAEMLAKIKQAILDEIALSKLDPDVAVSETEKGGE